MENSINEQINVQTQPAAAEREEKAEGVTDTGISLGKFKDVNALLNAYNSLQSEFTKRSQRLKELEGKAADKVTEEKTDEKTDGQAEEKREVTPAVIVGEESATREISISEEEKKKILTDYLKGVLDSKQKAVVIDGVGVGVKTPIEKPKSIAEAGMLAKDIFKQK